MSYEFDRENHIHNLDGKPLIGVTTALSVISKPALIQWSANEAVSYVEQNFPSFKEMVEKPTALRDVLKEAKTAHRKRKEKAGGFGTNVHDAIEKWIKGQNAPVLKDKMEQKALNNFKKWAKENEVEFIESEKHLYSRKYWIGGIVDLVFKMDGKTYIGDIKTSSGIYNEAFFQMGAYHIMLEEMGEADDIEGYIVINLKKNGSIDTKLADQMHINKKAFEHALGLYKVINSIV